MEVGYFGAVVALEATDHSAAVEGIVGVGGVGIDGLGVKLGGTGEVASVVKAVCATDTSIIGEARGERLFGLESLAEIGGSPGVVRLLVAAICQVVKSQGIVGRGCAGFYKGVVSLLGFAISVEIEEGVTEPE